MKSPAREALAADTRFGETLVREGVITREQLADAVAGQQAVRSQGVTMRLGEVLVAKRVLTPEQVRQFLHLADKVVLHCAKCGKNFNVKNWTPGKEVSCPGCSGALVPPPSGRTIDAHATKSLSPDAVAEARDQMGEPFGRYRLLKKLGQGGMGVVWKAWDTQLKRVVALKQILAKGEEDRDQVARFMREAQLAAKLRHPHIIAVHDVGEHAGQHYFTSEYVAGQSLEEAMKGRVSPKQMLSWVKDVAGALAYAHEQGVVHRDVKPANVLVDGHGQPFVMDFGLAKEVDLATKEGSRKATLTAAGAVMGTPMYMSPEQASGRTESLGPATDQFSLGVMLYQMLTNRLPFSGRSLGELFISIMHRDPVAPSRVNRRVHRDVETICMKSLEKDPKNRYASVAEMAADLERYLDGEPIHARPISAVEWWWRVARKKRGMWLSTAAALIVTTVSVVMWAKGTSAKSADISAAMHRGYEAESVARGASGEEAERQYALANEAFGQALALDKGNTEAKEGLDRARTRLEAIAQDRAKTLAGVVKRERESAAQASQEQEQRRTAEGQKKAQGEAQELLDQARTALEGALQYSYQKKATHEGLVARTDSVLDAVRKALARVPDLAQAYCVEGRARALRGDRELAAAALEKCMKLDPSSAAARFERGRWRVEEAYLQSRTRSEWEKEKKRPTFRALAEEGVSDLDAAAASMSSEEGLRREIASVARSVFFGSSSSPASDAQRALERLGALQGSEYLWWLVGLDSGGDQQQAAFEKALGIRPRYPLGLYSQAKALADRKDSDGAISKLDEALMVWPEFVQALDERGLLRLDRGDLAGALSDLDSALALRKGDAFLLKDRGEVRFARLEFDQAILDFTSAISAEPTYAEIYIDRGVANERKGELDRALSDFDAAVRLDPKSPLALTHRAIARRTKGDADAAIADCGAALALNSEWVAALCERSRDRLIRGDPDASLQDAEKAVSIASRDPEAYACRAHAREKKGNFDGAAADYRKALELAPQDWPERKETEQALAATMEEARRAAALVEPTDAPGFVKRGEQRLQVADWEGALQDFEAALKKKKGMPAALRGRAAARLGKGDVDGAVEDATNAWKADKKDVRTMLVLARALAAAGRMDDSLATLDRARGLAPADAEVASTKTDVEAVRDRVKGAMSRAGDLFQQSDFDGAATALDEALAANTRYARIVAGERAAAYARRFAMRGNVTKTNRHEVTRTKADFDRAVALDPSDANVRFARAVFRQCWCTDLDGAIADLTEALKSAPEEQELDSDAIAEMQRGEWLAPAPLREVYSKRAEIERGKGDLVGAIADYGNAMGHSKGRVVKPGADPAAIPDVSTSFHFLWQLQRGFTRDAAGDAKGALADYDAALKEVASGSSHVDISEIHAGRGRQAESRRDLATAIAEYERYQAQGWVDDWLGKQVKRWLEAAQERATKGGARAPQAPQVPDKPIATADAPFRIVAAKGSLVDSIPLEAEGPWKQPEKTRVLVVQLRVEVLKFEKKSRADWQVFSSREGPDTIIEAARLSQDVIAVRDTSGKVYQVAAHHESDGKWSNSPFPFEFFFPTESRQQDATIALYVPSDLSLAGLSIELGDYAMAPIAK